MAATQRIVSLIASATEIVCELGLRQQLVGISHECDFPEDVRGLPVLSQPKIDPRADGAEIDRQVRALAEQALSVYRVRADLLEQLAPDLIVTQDHCEVCAVSLKDVEQAICTLTLKETRVCSLNPKSLDDLLEDFRRVGRAAGVPERAEALCASFRARLDAVAERARGAARPRVACVEWLKPPMVAGGWMPEIVRIAGGEPVIVTDAKRFETVTWESLRAADPDLILILPCGYPIEQSLAELAGPALRAELDGLRAVREGRCFVCDGNAYFNRPGPRIADSTELLAALCHPDRFADQAARFRSSYARWP